MAATLSQLVGIFEPALRNALGLGSWQLISPGEGFSAFGNLQAVDSLATTCPLQAPAVLLTESVSGDDDIPEARQRCSEISNAKHRLS